MEHQIFFDELLLRYGALINKICYFYARDVEEFKDLRQEGLLNLWRSLDKFQNDCSIQTWIYRVVLNSCVSFIRKNKKGKMEPIEYHPELISEDSDKSGLISELYSLINRLDNLEKALMLLWLDGTDYETISNVTGLNRNTVGTRIHRIKNKLIEISNK